MAKNTYLTPAKPVRACPEVEVTGDNALRVRTRSDDQIQALLGMLTPGAANGVFLCALEALGASAKTKGQLVAAMYAEVEPRDAVEAMLVAQMTATYVAMTVASAKMSDATLFSVRESHERSMTRLSRTYLAQMEALKKYRAKAQQTVRVERVTVHEGGQAIVGNVGHGGEGGDGNRR